MVKEKGLGKLLMIKGYGMKDKALQKTLRRNYVRAEIAADEPHGADRRHRHAPAG